MACLPIGRRPPFRITKPDENLITRKLSGINNTENCLCRGDEKTQFCNSPDFSPKIRRSPFRRSRSSPNGHKCPSKSPQRVQISPPRSSKCHRPVISPAGLHRRRQQAAAALVTTPCRRVQSPCWRYPTRGHAYASNYQSPYSREALLSRPALHQSRADTRALSAAAYRSGGGGRGVMRRGGGGPRCWTSLTRPR